MPQLKKVGEEWAWIMARNMWQHRNISDNVHDIIRLTDFEHRLVNGPLFNRLHYVYQNSLAFFTWPAVRVQRFEHSLGCMHLAGEMFYSAIDNASTKDLENFSKIMKQAVVSLLDADQSSCAKLKKPDGSAFSRSFYRKLLDYVNKSINGDESYPDLEPFSFLIPARVPRRYHYFLMCLAEGVRLAGLLHDLGHPPFSHVCEQVLTELYKTCQKTTFRTNHAATKLTKAVDKYLDGKDIDTVALHEVIGNELSSLAISQAFVVGRMNCNELSFTYVAGLVALAILNDMEYFDQLHPIVCGTVDADRLDFVQRDSKASGVGADAMQYGRLIEGLRLIAIPGNCEKFVFALPSKTLPTVEDFLRKRLSNYKTIVFHHRVVKSEELLQCILKSLAFNYIGKHSDPPLESSDTSKKDSDSYVLPNDISGLWAPLGIALDNPDDAVLTFSQWNDSWVLTMLRNEYTRIKVDSPEDSSCSLLRLQLAELLYAEKSYHTIVKRSSDCIEFRDRLRKKIAENKERLQSDLDRCEIDISSPTDTNENRSVVDAHGIVEAMRSVINADKSSNILRIIDARYDAFKMAEAAKPYKTFTDFFKYALEFVLRDLKISYEDVIVTKNRIKTGVSGGSVETVFYSSDNVGGLNRQSAVASVLDREVSDLPAFYSYVLSSEVSNSNKHQIFIKLADLIYQFIDDCICESILNIS